jgi:predicted nucleic acid-binding protein
MPFLFDTDAISEPLRRRPLRGYVRWLATIPRDDQFASAVSVGELYRGAFLTSEPERHLANIDQRVLPAVTVLPYDTDVARVFGEIDAELRRNRRTLPEADVQIAATAIRHGLELVTGNRRHFDRIPGLLINMALVDARRSS